MQTQVQKLASHDQAAVSELALSAPSADHLALSSLCQGNPVQRAQFAAAATIRVYNELKSLQH